MNIEFVIFFSAWFLAGFVNGVSGFGAAMVALPIVAAFMPIKILVPTTCILVGILSVFMCALYYKHCRWRSLGWLLMGVLPGALLGLYVLLIISPAWLQFITGIVMIIFVFWQYWHKQNHGHQETGTLGVLTGFIASFINTAITFGNPPVAVFAVHVGWKHLEILGTMSVFTIVMNIASMSSHALAGLYSQEMFLYVGIGAVASLLGIAVAIPITKYINEQLFRKIILLVIGVAGSVCLYRAAIQLF